MTLPATDKDREDWRIFRKLDDSFRDLTKFADPLEPDTKQAYIRRLGLIRQIYMERMPEIMAWSAQHRLGWVDHQILDRSGIFTPIEEIAWKEIFDWNLPLYPQFPLFNYFIDFASPYDRIGLELDGKEWHDPQQDRNRDEFLASYGWRIFRVPGTETKVPYKDPVDLHNYNVHPDDWRPHIEHWLLNTCAGVIASLYYVYYSTEACPYADLCHRSLDRHRLAQFDLKTPIPCDGRN